MKIYPEEKPSMIDVTTQIMCALFASGHYTFPENPDESEQPGYFVIDNGKDWQDKNREVGPIFTGRYSTRALSHAMEIAWELMREMDNEEEFQKDLKKDRQEKEN